MRRRVFLLALLAPLPAHAAPPRPPEAASPDPMEAVRGIRRRSLARGIYGSGRRPHWSRNYTAAARPRMRRGF